MAKKCIRFATLALEYFGTLLVEDPEVFSTYLKSKNGDYGGDYVEGLLRMIFSERHLLRECMKAPDWDRSVFLGVYLLNQEPTQRFFDVSHLESKEEPDHTGFSFFPSFHNPKSMIPRFPTSVNLEVSEPGVWSTHKLFSRGDKMVTSLADGPIVKRKPLPAITHYGPRTLQ